MALDSWWYDGANVWIVFVMPWKQCTVHIPTTNTNTNILLYCLYFPCNVNTIFDANVQTCGISYMRHTLAWKWFKCMLQFDVKQFAFYLTFREIIVDLFVPIGIWLRSFSFCIQKMLRFFPCVGVFFCFSLLLWRFMLFEKQKTQQFEIFDRVLCNTLAAFMSIKWQRTWRIFQFWISNYNYSPNFVHSMN